MNSTKLSKIIIFLCLIASTFSLFSQNRSSKRGVSEEGFTYPEEVIALTPGVSWHYNWGITPDPRVADVVGPGTEMEFYPMTWNGRFNRNGLKEYLTNNPGVKYLLAFNEPNFKLQADMTPAEVVEIWPELEAIAREFDLEIVGPALNYSPDAPYHDPVLWYDEFFELLPEDAQVDYLALHCYMISSDAMMFFIDKIAERYGKKIWLTEFCAWDELTRDPTQARLIQRDEMVRKVEALELSENVEKYSWFKARGADSYPYYPLLKYRNESAGIPAGTLTDLGEIFVYMSSFDLNHYYSTTELIPATNYVKSEFITIEGNTDPESPFRLQIGSFGAYRTVDYLVDVPEEGEYPLTIRMASEEFMMKPYIEVYSDGVKVAEKELEETGDVEEWDVRIIHVNLPAGKQRLTLRSKESTTCKISWISLDSEIADRIGVQEINNEEIFIKHKEGQLRVESLKEIQKLMLYNMSGCLIKSVYADKILDVTELSHGIYLVHVCFEDGTKIVRKYIL